MGRSQCVTTWHTAPLPPCAASSSPDGAPVASRVTPGKAQLCT